MASDDYDFTVDDDGTWTFPDFGSGYDFSSSPSIDAALSAGPSGNYDFGAGADYDFGSGANYGLTSDYDFGLNFGDGSSYDFGTTPSTDGGYTYTVDSEGALTYPDFGAGYVPYTGEGDGYAISNETNPHARSIYELSTGRSNPGISLEDVLHPKGVNLDAMGGGFGATKDMPAGYYSPGTQDAEGNNIGGKEIPMSRGVLTALGMIPSEGASIALGDPNSWINNPNVTGDRVVVSPNNLVTSGSAYRQSNQPPANSQGITAPTIGTNQGLTISTAPGASTVKPEVGSRTTLENIADAVKSAVTPGGAGSVGAGSGGAGGAPGQQNQGSNWLQMLMMMLMLSQMNKGGGSSSGSSAVIPQLTAKREQTSAATQRPAGYRPGQGGVSYFQPTQYAAAGGAMGSGIGALGQYAAGGKGRLVGGNGDGVSDNIPATIDGVQPARIARGEYVIPARVVSELGNGSTDAGAERLDDMVSRIENSGRKAARGADSKAYKHIPT